MPKYIVYQTHNDNTRKITVINGQPYYQSTGHNSEMPGVWFPFLMIIGNKQIQQEDSLKKQYNCRVINLAFPKLVIGHILKFIDEFLNSGNELPAIARGRFPTKETLITSLRLGSNIPEVRSVLSVEEFTLSKIPLTFNEEESGKIISNPDAVNDWLVEQNAEFVKAALTDIPRIDPELIARQEGLEKTNHVDFLKYTMRFDVYKTFPEQYSNSYLSISTEIKRIKETTYGNSVDKIKKIITLLKLQSFILSAIEHTNISNKPLKPLDKIILDWKNAKSFSDETVNYALISEHRRTGFWGLFNIGRTNSQVFIDNLFNNSTKEDSSNCLSCF